MGLIKNTAQTLREMFLKFIYIIREIFYLVRQEKFFFLLPILIMLAVLAFLVYYIGPTVIMSFIYAGV